MHTKMLAQQQVAEQVLSHRWLSVAIARRFGFMLPGWVDRDDVQAAADLGLVESASRFDAGYGVPFAPYARLRITGAIRDELRARDPLSRMARQQLTRLQQARNMAAFGVDPTGMSGQAQIGGWQPPAAGRAAVFFQPLSLPLITDIADGQLVEDVVLSRERLRFVTVALVALPPHLAVMVPCSAETVSLRTLAKRSGVSVSTVSRQRTVALAWLRAAVGFYDGVPVANPQPFGPELRRYLARVTSQAAA